MKHAQFQIWLASLILAFFSVTAIATPLIIAHRGASGYLPEHTLEAAILAYGQGADYIEHDLDRADARIFLQCFDFDEIKRLRTELKARLPIIQLVGENAWRESTTDYTYLQSSEGLAEVARYAQGIGPWLPQLIDINSGKPLPLVRQARAAGLVIHPYTLRTDDLHGELSWSQWLKVLQDLQIEGIFTDFPDRAR